MMIAEKMDAASEAGHQFDLWSKPIGCGARFRELVANNRRRL
jgi:hypothetical protein